MAATHVYPGREGEQQNTQITFLKKTKQKNLKECLGHSRFNNWLPSHSFCLKVCWVDWEWGGGKGRDHLCISVVSREITNKFTPQKKQTIFTFAIKKKAASFLFIVLFSASNYFIEFKTDGEGIFKNQLNIWIFSYPQWSRINSKWLPAVSRAGPWGWGTTGARSPVAEGVLEGPGWGGGTGARGAQQPFTGAVSQHLNWALHHPSRKAKTE